MADPVIIGRLNGLYGVRGALKVFSYTEPRAAICDYGEWLLWNSGQWQPYNVADGRRHGKTVVARLAGVEDRSAAARLLGADIGIRRETLPEPEPGRYYWADLVGCEVVTVSGQRLGHTKRLFGTVNNDVLVVAGERERLLPFIDAVIRRVDLAGGVITVDWDPDF